MNSAATTPIYFNEDVLDSRDIIERIAYLEIDQEELDEDEQNELDYLKALADEGQRYADDWAYGVALIADDYFEDYAKELATDLHGSAVEESAGWPFNHIDWEAAAESLKDDYTELNEVNGATFWVR